MRERQRLRYELIREAAKASPHPSRWESFVKMGSLMRKHHRQCEQYCNGDIDNDTPINITEENIKHVITSLNHPNGWDDDDTLTYRVEFQHDPRGPTVKVYVGVKGSTAETHIHYLPLYAHNGKMLLWER